MKTTLLELKQVDAYYGDLHVLKGVSYHIEEGEIVCLLGANGAGKSTTMKTIMGAVKASRGQITFNGRDLTSAPTVERVRAGIAVVLEGRRLFGRMSVLENLEMGAYTRRDSHNFKEDLDRVFALFPRVKERKDQVTGTMSGGEQQMVAIGRALMARPKLICMDEPSMGLSPLFVEQTFSIIQEINKQGTSIFMIEQNANMALSVANRGYVLQTGQVVLSGDAKEMQADKTIQEAYLGELHIHQMSSAQKVR